MEERYRDQGVPTLAGHVPVKGVDEPAGELGQAEKSGHT